MKGKLIVFKNTCLEKLLLGGICDYLIDSISVSNDIPLLVTNKGNYDENRGFLTVTCKLLYYTIYNNEFIASEIRNNIKDLTKNLQTFKRLYVSAKTANAANEFNIVIGTNSRKDEEIKITYGLGLIEHVITPK